MFMFMETRPRFHKWRRRTRSQTCGEAGTGGAQACGSRDIVGEALLELCWIKLFGDLMVELADDEETSEEKDIVEIKNAS